MGCTQFFPFFLVKSEYLLSVKLNGGDITRLLRNIQKLFFFRIIPAVSKLYRKNIQTLQVFIPLSTYIPLSPILNNTHGAILPVPYTSITWDDFKNRPKFYYWKLEFQHSTILKPSQIY